MAEIIEIFDAGDPAIAPYTRLTEAQMRSRQRPGEAIFIAESVPVISLALDAGYEVVSVLAEEKQVAGQAAELIRWCGDVKVYSAADGVFEAITGFAPSRGVMAVMKRRALPSVEEVCRGASRIAVIENVTDATNVGAIIRSAAALGIDAVLVTPSCSDPLNRRSARVSMGTVFQVPWTYIGEKAGDWSGQGLEMLRGMGFVTAALALRSDAISVDDARLKDAEKLALILGTEGTGLCDETISSADYAVKIPMYHGVDSLNVAAASAVAFWETRRVK